MTQYLGAGKRKILSWHRDTENSGCAPKPSFLEVNSNQLDLIYSKYVYERGNSLRSKLYDSPPSQTVASQAYPSGSPLFIFIY